MRLVVPEQMREMDRRTIEEIGVPGVVLMERAALGATEFLVERFDGGELRRVGFLCGGGNNGGDGVAMARMLDNRGYETELVFLSATDAIDGDAGKNLEIAENLGLDYTDLGDREHEEVVEELAALPFCEVWVDALLGTGLTGEVRGRYVAAISFLNGRDSVFAVDIPSGINGSDGQIMGTAVEADATATFGGAKVGQALYPGRGHCGDLEVVDIGIPDTVRESVGFDAEWLDGAWAQRRIAPRPEVYHKGASGRVLAVAGSHEKTGAAILVARGALAGGAGLITVGTTPQVVPRIAPAVNEVMAAELVSAEEDDEVSSRLADFLETVDTVAVGPGLETHDGAAEAVGTILESEVEHAVFDADALNLVAQQFGDALLSRFAGDSLAVVTPHPGEMARLCDRTVDEILGDPVGCASDYADKTGAIVVLKMAATVIASPEGRVAINRSGNPGMATGGMGDVLTGIVAARITESTGDAFEDVCLAVWAHGRAGDLAAADRGERSLGAVELAGRLGDVWSAIEETSTDR